MRSDELGASRARRCADGRLGFDLANRVFEPNWLSPPRNSRPPRGIGSELALFGQFLPSLSPHRARLVLCLRAWDAFVSSCLCIFMSRFRLRRSRAASHDSSALRKTNV